MQLFKRKNKTKTKPEISIDKNNLIDVTGHICVIDEVKHIEHRQFYDSTWEINFSEVSGDFSLTIKIIRSDIETKENLVNTLNNLHTLKEILLLDEKGKIYYD